MTPQSESAEAVEALVEEVMQRQRAYPRRTAKEHVTLVARLSEAEAETGKLRARLSEAEAQRAELENHRRDNEDFIGRQHDKILALERQLERARRRAWGVA